MKEISVGQEEENVLIRQVNTMSQLGWVWSTNVCRNIQFLRRCFRHITD